MSTQLSFPDGFGQSPSTRVRWVEILAHFGQQLEEIAAENGLASVLDLQLSAGWMLLGITELLELDEQERFVVLGQHLYEDVLESFYLQQDIEQLGTGSN